MPREIRSPVSNRQVGDRYGLAGSTANTAVVIAADSQVVVGPLNVMLEAMLGSALLSTITSPEDKLN